MTSLMALRTSGRLINTRASGPSKARHKGPSGVGKAVWLYQACQGDSGVLISVVFQKGFWQVLT
jgi:hypothetical protein